MLDCAWVNWACSRWVLLLRWSLVFRRLRQPNPALNVGLCSPLCFLGPSCNLECLRPRSWGHGRQWNHSCLNERTQDNLHLNWFAKAGRDHVQPGCGSSQCCFSACWQFTWSKGLFLVLFRMTVRALIREDASTESGLLPDRCTESFTKGRRVGGNQSATAMCGLGQGIFFFPVFVTGNLRSHFL